MQRVTESTFYAQPFQYKKEDIKETTSFWERTWEKISFTNELRIMIWELGKKIAEKHQILN